MRPAWDRATNPRRQRPADGPGPVSHSAAPPPSLEFALPIPLSPGPATQRDLKTEKVSRAAQLEEQPGEVTVPSPDPAATWDADEASGPEVTLPAPGAFLAPDDVAVDVALERSAVFDRSSPSGLRDGPRPAAAGRVRLGS